MTVPRLLGEPVGGPDLEAGADEVSGIGARLS